MTGSRNYHLTAWWGVVGEDPESAAPLPELQRLSGSSATRSKHVIDGFVGDVEWRMGLVAGV